MMPIERMNDPAEVIEINARMYPVEELYLETIVDNMLGDKEIQKTA